VLNLLSNAVKFTPPGGEITIKVGWTSSGGQYLSVKDSGPGIPARLRLELEAATMEVDQALHDRQA
jgi:signal transduction histidine kinase